MFVCLFFLYIFSLFFNNIQVARKINIMVVYCVLTLYQTGERKEVVEAMIKWDGFKTQYVLFWWNKCFLEPLFNHLASITMIILLLFSFPLFVSNINLKNNNCFMPTQWFLPKWFGKDNGHLEIGCEKQQKQTQIFCHQTVGTVGCYKLLFHLELNVSQKAKQKQQSFDVLTLLPSSCCKCYSLN